MSTIYFGADHGGFELKQQLLEWLTAQGYTVEDVGAFSMDPADDYPDFAFKVAEKVAADQSGDAKGVVLCRTSAGVVIAANKVAGIKAASTSTPELAEAARAHNNANVIGLGADHLDFEKAKAVIDTFLKTEFSNDERHVRRLSKIETYEQK